MKNTKIGIIRYDAKHDSYFIQSGHTAYSLFMFSVYEYMLDQTVEFVHTTANEVIDFKETETCQ